MLLLENSRRLRGERARERLESGIWRRSQRQLWSSCSRGRRDPRSLWSRAALTRRSFIPDVTRAADLLSRTTPKNSRRFHFTCCGWGNLNPARVDRSIRSAPGRAEVARVIQLGVLSSAPSSHSHFNETVETVRFLRDAGCRERAEFRPGGYRKSVCRLAGC